MEPRAGTRIAGKYVVLRPLGEGGMGIVVAARNEALGRDVAIKVLHRRFAAREEIVARFLREARAAASLRHPNVVDVLDVDRDEDGTPFIVLELLEGETLMARLRRGPMSVEEVRALLLPAMDGVALAHAKGIVHRDLKPENVFLHRDARGDVIAKVLDFGVAKAALGDAAITSSDALLGTPLYMAPEHVASAKDVGPAADVWSMGVVLFEALSGERPFALAPGASPYQVISAISTQRPRSLGEVAPELDRGWIAAIDRALARDPRDRHADVGAFAAALRALGGDASAATSIDARPVAPRSRSGRSLVVPIALGIASAIGIAFVVLRSAGTDPPAAQRPPQAAPVVAEDDGCTPAAGSRAIAQVVSGLAIAWGDARRDVEDRCGPTVDVGFSQCLAPHVELRRIEGPIGIGPGSVQLAYSREGLFEVFAETDRARDEVIADVARALGAEPEPTAIGARWDVGEERLAIATARGRTTLRAFHRPRQQRYAAATEGCRQGE